MAYPSELKTGGTIMNGASLPASGNVASDIVNIERAKTIGLDIEFDETSSLLGTLYIEVCNDINRATPNWVPVTLNTGATSVAVSGDLNDFYNLSNLGANYLRVLYAPTSGTGTGYVVAHVKTD